MSIFSTIFKPVSDIVGNVLDKTITDKNEAQRLKHEINMAIMNEGEQALKGATEIIVAESNGSFLQRNWRPVTMLTFVGLVVCKWLGLTDQSVTPEVELELMQLIQIGLGGYVVGRSGEKIAKAWKAK
jgi:hypothetical protein